MRCRRGHSVVLLGSPLWRGGARPRRALLDAVAALGGVADGGRVLVLRLTETDVRLCCLACVLYPDTAVHSEMYVCWLWQRNERTHIHMTFSWRVHHHSIRGKHTRSRARSRSPGTHCIPYHRQCLDRARWHDDSRARRVGALVGLAVPLLLLLQCPHLLCHLVQLCRR